MGYRLGVDLGTTFTAAAVDDGGGPRMVGLGNRALQVPSVLCLQDDGTFLCGEAAERRSATQPDRVVREFKRRLGDTVPVLVAGQPFSPQALTATLLRWVVDTVTEREGEGPDEVVLTRPANWGGFKQELFAQVGALADLPRADTCTEPEAAATQYAARAPLGAGERLVVYDLGGGTFDVCVLEKREQGFAIVGSPDGVEHLGGIDFDEAVFRHVLGLLGDRLEGLDPDDAATSAALARLRRDCVDAKEALSTDVSTVVPVALPAVTTTVRMTRSELEELITPALRETLAATQRALRSSETDADRLSAVVLVGGSSRIPAVGQLLQAELGVRTAMDTHPKHDVPLGAARTTVAEPVHALAQGASAPPGVSDPAQAVAGPEPVARSRGGTAPQPAASGPGRRPLLYGLAALLAFAVAVVLAFTAAGSPPEGSAGGGTRWGSEADVPAVRQATSARLEAFGLPLPGSSDVTTARGRSVLEMSTTQWLFAAGPMSVALEADGEAVDASRYLEPRNEEGRWWQPVATVPGVAMVLLALFALAYGESLARGLRQGTRALRVGELLGLTGVGLLLGVSLVLAGWLAGGLPELDIAALVLLFAGVAGAVTAVALAGAGAAGPG